MLSAIPRSKGNRGKIFTRYLLLLPVGIGGIWGFYFHAFYLEQSAEMIGWNTSPFQFEVAVTNLGLGIAGILDFGEVKIMLSVLRSLFSVF